MSRTYITKPTASALTPHHKPAETTRQQQASGVQRSAMPPSVQRKGNERSSVLDANGRPVKRVDQHVFQMLQARARNPLSKPELGDKSSVYLPALRGVQGTGSKLPHFDKVQASFGQHDLSHVQAYTGSHAKQASDAIGAEAYATGSKVAFADSNPSLHTVAHEAAHVIQQQAGVQLKGGVGEAGDQYERQADTVADAVVQGKSAETLLGNSSFKQTVQNESVQRKIRLGAGTTDAGLDKFQTNNSYDPDYDGYIEAIITHQVSQHFSITLLGHPSR